jgi:hypothetical protein
VGNSPCEAADDEVRCEASSVVEGGFNQVVMSISRVGLVNLLPANVSPR